MKIKNKVLVTLSASLVTLTLASCGGDKVNQVVPYGSLNVSLDKAVATANNDQKITLNQYYTKLRSKSYDIVSSQINKALYLNEFNALKNMLASPSLEALKDKEASVNALKIVEKFEDKDEKVLYDITPEKYLELREKLLETINSSLGSAILGTANEESVAKLSETDLNTKLLTFIDNQAVNGVSLTKEDIKWITKDNNDYILDKDSKLIQFETSTINKLETLVDSYLLSEAEKLSSKKGLAKIVNMQTVYDKEKETNVKNTRQYFEDDDLKAKYDQTYKTYGTYQAITIKFNTLKEAIEAINKVSTTGRLSNDPVEAKEQYIAIYNDYYSFKENITAPITYRVSKIVNELSDLNSSVSDMILNTLEDNEFFVEPRNLNDSYYLIFKFDTNYTVHGEKANEQVEFNKLSDTDKEKYTELLKEDILNENAVSYASENKKNLLADAKLEIYDPLFETKFYYANPDDYTRITSTVSNTYSAIFKTSNYEYTVEDFYKEASNKYASDILTEYFTLDYTYKYYDTYVNDHYIDKNLHSTNSDKLDEDIKKFEAGNATEYPANVGLQVYLTGTYGYDNKEDVLKYYYDATQARTTYLNKKVYLEWTNDEHNVTDIAKTGFLTQLLEKGNENYKNIFDINLDHILINIDDDGDGSPDDPDEFLRKYPNVADEFKEAVTALAKALYLDAINAEYKDNTLYKTLTHIKSEYEAGAQLKSDPTKTWNDFKKFNFLLTVEQLASSSNITETSVNNFVVPFADYVKNVYKLASSSNTDTSASSSYTNGIFYFVYPSQDGGVTGHTASTAEQANLVTYDALCKTSFGYHMLVLNSYSKPRSTKSSASSDSIGAGKDIQINLQKYTDEDDVEHTTYVKMDYYNEDETEKANFNQLFIYYVQKANGDSSSLESTIATLMGRMFDNVISNYQGTTFQNYLLLKTLDIKVTDEAVNGYKLNSLFITGKVKQYENNLTTYGKYPEYESWFVNSSEDLAKWARPDLLK